MFFLVAIVVSVTVLSFVLTRTFEAANTRTVNLLNQEVLEETRRVNEYVRRMIRVSGMELFFEPAVQRLMHRVDLSNFEELTGLRRIDSVQSMGTHIHSIYVYNPKREFIYSSSNYRSGYIDSFYDSGVKDLLFAEREPMRLVPIPRVLRYKGRDEPLYSFIYYDPMSFQGPIQGALIINVTLDWLGEVLGSEANTNALQLFVNREGQIVYHPDRSRFLADISDKPFMRTIMSSGADGGYFVDGRGSDRTLTMFSRSDDGDLYLIRQVPYSHFMRPLWVLRARVLALVCVFLLIGSAMAFVFSRRIYRPIGELVTSLPAESPDEGSSEQDLSDMEYLSSRIETMISETSSLEETSEVYRATLRSDLLKELLHGNMPELPLPETAELFANYGLHLDPGGDFAMALMKSGTAPYPGLETVSAPSSTEEREKLFELDMGGHRILLWQDEPPLEGYDAEILITSGTIQGVAGLAAGYENMLDLYNKLLLFGNTGVFSAEDYIRDVREFNYPTEQEKTLLHSIKAGNSELSIQEFETFLDVISEYRYDQVRFSLKRLFVSLQFQAKELQSQGYFSRSSEFCMHEFEACLGSIRGRSQLVGVFGELFTLFKEEMQRHRQVRVAKLVSEIEHIVEGEYSDANLSPARIAEQIGLSTPYLSRIYKELRPYSLSEFILNFRIEQAKCLLKDDISLSAREIAVRVGFSNENYFYTLFRKRTGYTPNTYRKQLALVSTPDAT